MGRRRGASGGDGWSPRKPVTLKALAEQLQLSSATVSLVLNQSPVAEGFTAETRERVLTAAREAGYRPNFLARSLRSRRTYSIGVLVRDVVDSYTTIVLAGIESHLLQEGYFYLVASHQSNPELRDEYFQLLMDRLVDGFLLVNTPLSDPPELPTVAVSGHEELEGVTNVVVDHDLAAEMALSHLAELGHRRIALFKGQPGSADTEDRWRAILEAAKRLQIELVEELMVELGSDNGEVFNAEVAYDEGYARGKVLLDRRRDFSALFAFNDVSAIGAMRAFQDAGLRIPQDVSVVGFDDIPSAAFHNPKLTTVRQPLREMGAIAGRILVERLAGEKHPRVLALEPQLKVRESTGPARSP